MAELCFNTFNRSAYLIEDPDLPTSGLDPPAMAPEDADPDV